MSPWSRESSSRWAHDVAASSHDADEDNEPRLPLPVQQPSTDRSSPSRSMLRSAWRRLQRHRTARAGPADVQSPHPLHDLLPAEVESKADDAEIDEVVVDRCWSKEYASSSHASVSDDAGDDFEQRYNPKSTYDRSGFWAACAPLTILRWTVWPVIAQFFDSRFADPNLEREYQKEVWAEGKGLSELASVFLVVNWLMAVLSIQTPTVLADKIFYYGISPVLTLPVLAFCRYDFYFRYPRFFQTFVCVSAWSWAFYQVLYAYMCGYYGHDGVKTFSCGTKDFLSTFYYASALQTVALFGLNMRRIPGLIGPLAFLIFSTVLIIPQRHSWYRNIINFLAFQAFILYMHFQRDGSARRLHLARIRLKLQIDKTTKAQNSKYRLISYVFHDKFFFRSVLHFRPDFSSQVRVPLNTALLAAQNMDAAGTVPKDMALEFNALEGSLSQMSKVLNDVLDFNRMDSGKFEVLMRPYPFHQVLGSMFLTLKLATEAREIDFETDLDPKIDEFACRARYKAQGESEDGIEALLAEEPSAPGIVSGDENRLRQIITNLAGNACKFTPQGGKLKITTRLIYPVIESESSEDETKACSINGSKTLTPGEKPTQVGLLSTKDLEEHNRIISQYEESEKIVVRIEVTDTGLGIPPQDMANASIFSAFIQTEQGRTQGGKGTGLGLALVRRIVTLSGGRLGVRSKVGAGSTFWVELPLGVGSKVLTPIQHETFEPLAPPAFIDMYPLAASKTLESTTSYNNTPRSAIDQTEMATLRRTQASPILTRSPAAIHGLMNQGGSVQLSLAKFDSYYSPVPMRTMGDPSTGTELPSSSYRDDHSDSTGSPMPSVSYTGEVQTITQTTRPTYIPLPSPRSFNLDDPQPLPTSATLTVGADGMATYSAPTPALAAPPSRSALFNSCPVLVVDDDRVTRSLMSRMLQRLGCNVTTAANGLIAYNILMGSDALKTRTPDSEGSGPILGDFPAAEVPGQEFAVIFLDNQMPVMSGLKCVAQLRQAGRKDFVVGVTGNALITDQKEYLEAGADHVLTKPVLEQSLSELVREGEQRRERQRKAAS